MLMLTRFLIPIALMTLVASIFWSYRVKADYEAPLFAPSARQPVVLPAATQIEAVIADGIASSAKAGDSVTAFVSTPIFLNGGMVIPPGAQLQGILENTSVSRKKVKADITFTHLILGGRSYSIQTQRTGVVAPKRKDVKTLLNALNTIVGAGIGLGIGAPSGDARLIEHGLVLGARSSLKVRSGARVTVTLSSDLRI
jgi:hypothetical protein